MTCHKTLTISAASKTFSLCLQSKTMASVSNSKSFLYIIGYFEVEIVGMAADFPKKTLKAEFGNNFHVRYPSVFKVQREQLVPVKGGFGSRLLGKAHKVSTVGTDRTGKPLKILSPKMQKVFGDFGGHISIQRSPPCGWIRNVSRRQSSTLRS